VDEGYSVSMEQEPRESEPFNSATALATQAAYQAATEEGDEEEDEAPPLDDLLPTLSFNELGQSLMDVRGARAHLAQETLRENETPDSGECFYSSVSLFYN